MATPSTIIMATSLPVPCRGWLVAATAALLLAPSSQAAEGPKAPPANVDEPPRLTLAELPDAHAWTTADWQAGGLDYKVDLDLLAPLGTGGGNLAIWLARFMDGGPEGDMAMARAETVEIPGFGDWSLLPFDDPLLLEAEPWIDQRTCRFYPDVFTYDGFDSLSPDLRLAVVFSRTWIARGLGQPATVTAAKADVRRAIRLGRLLLQDDVMVVQNLVGIALIRAGAEALYELARRAGRATGAPTGADGAGAALAALVLLDSAALRAETIRRMDLTETVLAHLVEPPIVGRLIGPVLDIQEVEVRAVISVADSPSSRALRLQALTSLYLILHMGTRSQREAATATLERLAGDADPLVAATASKLRKREFDKAELFRRAAVIQ